MPVFPHLDDTDFPNIDSVNVWQYENNFDYERYDYTQMRVTVCSVPWDMGEAHVGNRSISGIGNVVFFEDEAARDAWFSSIPDSNCFRFETKFKELHRDNQIIVPLPFDIASNYNYVTVEYSLFANDNSPIAYENAGGLRKWFWFIREVEFVAPNATKLHLMNDAWQTFIYHVDIPYMLLERGHAPLFATDVATYLSNPRSNCANLLEPDSYMNQPSENVVKNAEIVFDSGDMYAVFVLTSTTTESWGTGANDVKIVPARDYYHRDGNLSYNQLAIPVSDLYSFLGDVSSNVPWFKQTVKCVYLVSSKLVTLGTKHTFYNHDMWELACTQKSETILTLTKNDFAFDAAYANIAKLYTYPYSKIVITDEKGNAIDVRIEETDGTIDVGYALNTVFPTLNINAYLKDIAGATKTITFKNVNSRTFTIGGRWYDIQWDWAVPQFGIVLEASDEYDYSGYYEREQAEREYNAVFDNATDRAYAAKTNAYCSAEAARDNADDAAQAAYDNAGTSYDANTFRRGKETGYITDKFSIAGEKVNAERALAAANSWRSTQTSLNNVAISSVVSGATQVAGGFMSGGAAGGVASAGSAALNGISTFHTAGNDANLAMYTAQNQILHMDNMYGSNSSTDWDSGSSGIIGGGFDSTPNNYKDAVSGYTGIKNGSIIGREVAYDKAIVVNRFSASNSELQAHAQTNWACVSGGYGGDFNNPISGGTDFGNGTAARSEQAAKDNADTTKSTEDTIAQRNQVVAQEAVLSRTYTMGLRAPLEYGTWRDGQNANVKGKGLFASIVTQSKAAIAYAGDEFLRYGYRFNRQWAFDGKWVPTGHKFCYWKLADFWVKGLTLPDMYMDKLRFFLFGGVTVWSTPESIGNNSIYDNGV